MFLIEKSKVLVFSHLDSLPKFDLVTFTFHENSNPGRENYWKFGVPIPALEGQKSFVLFQFIFKFFTHNWVSLILTIFCYLVLLLRNEIKHVEHVCFYWYLICKTIYSKLVKNKEKVQKKNFVLFFSFIFKFSIKNCINLYLTIF